jgi:hypothetical protein
LTTWYPAVGRTSPQCPGWESNPHCPKGRPLYRRPGGPPRDRGSTAIGRQWHRWELNPHTPRFELGRSASWRTVPFIESAQWESNPHVRHGKAAGNRYIMGACDVPSFKFQVRSLQLGTRNLKPGTFPCGSGGSRTHVVPLKRRAPRRHRPHFLGGFQIADL